MKIKEVIKKIDNKKFYSRLVENILKENVQESFRRKKAFNRIKYAVRYFCLLDLYYETKDKKYPREAEKQKRSILVSLNKAQIKELESIESDIIKFFRYEKSIVDKTKRGLSLSEKEIHKFVKMRSGDAIYYAKIFEFFTGVNLSDQIRIHTILSDIEKDFFDYKEDFQKYPNVLYLYILTKIKKQNAPKKLEKAVNLIKNLKIDKKIISFVSLIYKKSKKLDFDRCMALNKDIQKKYNKILYYLKGTDEVKALVRETNDLGKNLLKNKGKYNCFTGLSMGKKFFSKRNIKLYFQFAAEYCKKYLLLIGDEVEKWNYIVFKNLNKKEALERARKRGTNYERAFFNVLADFDKNKINIIRITDLPKQKEYKKLLKVIKEYYKKDGLFRKDVEKEIWNNIGGKVNELRGKITKKEFNKKLKLLVNYILEEISIIIYVTEFYKGGYPIEIYPDKDIQIKRNIYNKRYKGLYEKLSLKGSRGHIFLDVEIAKINPKRWENKKLS